MAGKKRSYLKQSDVPRTSLDEALRIPKAILEQYAGESTTPFNVAKATDLDPNGSQMKVITGSAIAFGLTEGGAQSSSISITDLAKTILRPLDEGADLAARKEALLKPRIFGEFLNKYDTHTFPRDDIARNVLIDMGVPDDQAEDVRQRIEESAESMGFIETIKNKKYIHLNSIAQEAEKLQSEEDQETEDEEYASDTSSAEDKAQETKSNINDSRSRKVFITRGKNKDFIEPIKKLLGFGEMIPVVSVEKQSVSKPVPDKVMDDMRSCGAAIIHVDAERTLIDKEANEFNLVNENVLIEIGAAMALYGRRFILLVKNGVKLPSNLQGLYEVRYADEKLDGDATIRLLEAINDIKNNPSPDRYMG